MKSRLPLFMLLGLVAVGALGWFLLPAGFARGVIMGFVAGPLAILGVLTIVGRRMRKGLGERLRPPTLPTAASWDYAWTVSDLEGESVDPEQYRGRVLVLNVWATWCAPCIAELPSLEALADAVTELEVDFACVTSEPADTVRTFLAKRPVRLPVYTAAELPDIFRSGAIPATYVIDRTGAIALRHTGAARWDDPGVVSFVRGLAVMP